MSVLSVREALRGKHILVTGFTGFLGKVFVALLLEEVPEIGRITLLVRGKRAHPARKRVQHLLERSPGVRNLREKHGAAFGAFAASKIDVVAGDVRDPLCGIDPRVLESLTSSLDAVVHVAGLTDFAPDPNDAIAVNVRGALHAADLAARTRGRKLLHVSTCFVAGNVDGPVAETLEVGLSPNGTRFSPRDELGSIESVCAATSKRHTDPADGRRARIEAGTLRAQAFGWPNLYTYSKGLAEHLVAARGDVDLCIVRPSIVECAEATPFEGWNEGINTSGPLVWLVGTLHRRMPFAEHHCFDVVPVDAVAKGMALSLAQLLRAEAPPVVQLASGDVNPFTFGRAVDLTSLLRRRQFGRSSDPFERLVLYHLDSVTHEVAAAEDPWLPAARKATRLVRDALSAFKPQHHLPASIEARWGSQLGKWANSQARAWGNAARSMGQVEEMLRLYQPFVFDHDIRLATDHIRHATRSLVEEERAAFAWTVPQLDWRSYWLNVQVPGLDRWCLPLLRGERVPEDPPMDLGCELAEYEPRDDAGRPARLAEHVEAE